MNQFLWQNNLTERVNAGSGQAQGVNVLHILRTSRFFQTPCMRQMRLRVYLCNEPILSFCVEKVIGLAYPEQTSIIDPHLKYTYYGHLIPYKQYLRNEQTSHYQRTHRRQFWRCSPSACWPTIGHNQDKGPDCPKYVSECIPSVSMLNLLIRRNVRK